MGFGEGGVAPETKDERKLSQVKIGKREQDPRLEGRCQGPVVGKPWSLSIGEGETPSQLSCQLRQAIKG